MTPEKNEKHRGLKDHIGIFLWLQHNSRWRLSENQFNISIYNQELLKTIRKTKFYVQNLLQLLLSFLTELKKLGSLIYRINLIKPFLQRFSVLLVSAQARNNSFKIFFFFIFNFVNGFKRNCRHFSLCMAF